MLECLSGREDDSREKNKHRLLLETVLADVKLSDFGVPSDTGSQFHNSFIQASLHFHREQRKTFDVVTLGVVYSFNFHQCLLFICFLFFALSQCLSSVCSYD